jgi:hypothetical protein
VADRDHANLQRCLLIAAWQIAPQTLNIVKLAGFSEHDVYDDRSQINQDPVSIFFAFGADDRVAFGF